MPTIRLTKSAIDALPTLPKDNIYWDAGHPGFGVKVTPRGRKVFIALIGSVVPVRGFANTLLGHTAESP